MEWVYSMKGILALEERPFTSQRNVIEFWPSHPPRHGIASRPSRYSQAHSLKRNIPPTTTATYGPNLFLPTLKTNLSWKSNFTSEERLSLGEVGVCVCWRVFGDNIVCAPSQMKRCTVISPSIALSLLPPSCSVSTRLTMFPQLLFTATASKKERTSLKHTNETIHPNAFSGLQRGREAMRGKEKPPQFTSKVHTPAFPPVTERPAIVRRIPINSEHFSIWIEYHFEWNSELVWKQEDCDTSSCVDLDVKKHIQSYCHGRWMK